MGLSASRLNSMDSTEDKQQMVGHRQTGPIVKRNIMIFQWIDIFLHPGRIYLQCILFFSNLIINCNVIIDFRRFWKKLLKDILISFFFSFCSFFYFTIIGITYNFCINDKRKNDYLRAVNVMCSQSQWLNKFKYSLFQYWLTSSWLWFFFS